MINRPTENREKLISALYELEATRPGKFFGFLEISEFANLTSNTFILGAIAKDLEARKWVIADSRGGSRKLRLSDEGRKYAAECNRIREKPVFDNDREIPNLGSLEDLGFSEIQDVALLAFLTAATNDRGPDTILIPGDLIDISGVGDYLIDKSIEGLRDRKLVSPLNDVYWGVSAKGLNYYERQKNKHDSFLNKNLDFLDVVVENNLPHHISYFIGMKPDKIWNHPDLHYEISQTQLMSIQSTLDEILRKIENLNLPQADKAQAAGTIRATQELANVPNPPLYRIRQLLKPLAELSDIGSLVRRILDFFT